MQSHSPHELLSSILRSIVSFSFFFSLFSKLVKCSYGRGGQEARDNGIDAQFGEFCCPLCSSLANTVVPIMKQDLGGAADAVLSPAEFWKGLCLV